jgi:hypothetical protein
MVNLENNEVEEIIKALEQFNDGAVGIPGHAVGALIEKLRKKLQDATPESAQVRHLGQGFGRGKRPKVPKRT